MPWLKFQWNYQIFPFFTTPPSVLPWCVTAFLRKPSCCYTSSFASSFRLARKPHHLPCFLAPALSPWFLRWLFLLVPPNIQGSWMRSKEHREESVLIHLPSVLHGAVAAGPVGSLGVAQGTLHLTTAGWAARSAWACTQPCSGPAAQLPSHPWHQACHSQTQTFPFMHTRYHTLTHAITWFNFAFAVCTTDAAIYSNKVTNCTVPGLPEEYFTGKVAALEIEHLLSVQCTKSQTGSLFRLNQKPLAN